MCVWRNERKLLAAAFIAAQGTCSAKRVIGQRLFALSAVDKAIRIFCLDSVCPWVCVSRFCEEAAAKFLNQRLVRRGWLELGKGCKKELGKILETRIHSSLIEFDLQSGVCLL